MPEDPKPKGRHFRRQEMREIERLIDDAGRGKGSLVFLVGQEGLGRSTACREAGEIARKKGFITVALECPQGAEGKWLYSEIKKMIEDRTIPEIGTVTSLGIRRVTPEEDQSLFNEWFMLISETSKAKPLFISIDDAENSDPQTFRMLHYLALRLKNIRGFILCSLNPGKLSDSGVEQIFARMKQDGVIIIIEMKPLGIKETEEIIASTLGIDHPPSELCSGIYEITQGYPKFVREMAESVLGVMKRRGIPVEKVDLQQIDVPEGIIRRYQERVKTLSANELDLCKLASCLGGKFSLDILQILLQKEEDLLLDLIESMISKRFIREMGKGNNFAFIERHFIEYVYNNLMNEEERRKRHKEIADLLRREVDNGKEVFLQEVGRQYALAGEYVSAYKAYIQAGDKAKVIYANEDAIQAYNLAMKCIRMDPDRFTPDSKMVLLSNLAEVEITIGLLDEAETNLYALAEMKRNKGEQRGECEAYIQLGNLYRKKRSLDQALKVFIDAYNTALSIGDTYLISETLKHLGTVYYYMNDPEKALEYASASLKGSSPVETPVEYAKKLSLLGSIYSLKGEYARASELYREAITLLSKRNPREEARVRRFLAEILKFMGDFSGCINEAETAAKIAGITQYTSVESIAHSIAGEAYAMLGQKERAHEHLDIAERLLQSTTEKVAEIVFLICRGAYFTVTRDYQRAISDLEKAIDLSRKMNLMVYEAEALFRVGVAHHYSYHQLKKRDNLRASYELYKKLGNQERARLCKAWLES